MKDPTARSLTETYSHATLGRLVARVLSGAWRQSAGALNFSENEITAVTPLLYSSGSAALAWWRVRDRVSSPTVREGNLREKPLLTRGLLTPSAAIGLLHDAYRQLRLAALVHEREIKHVLALLRAVDIGPVLVKGWAIARRYPDRALRPYGDIDLCVRPDQFAKAADALKCLEGIEGHYVDLHAGFRRIGVAPHVRVRHDDHECDSWDELFERSQVVSLGDEKVRVLSDEDHLRLLCLHFLRSGAWRPPWLCDVALLVEERGSDFDWHRCLGRDPLYADWVACTIGLAHQLFGVDVENTPVAGRAHHLPRWLAPAVLNQWGRGRAVGGEQWTLGGSVSSPTVREGHLQDNPPTAQSSQVKQSATAISELYSRWNNPVRATAAVGGQLNNWPRLPYRLAESIMRSRELPEALAQIVRQFAARKKSVAAPPPHSAVRLDLTEKLS
jgi:hypothetical protein